MELWLIRHALPIRVDGGEAPADPGLAPEGLEQADQMGRWWAPFGVDAIYVSPMARAQETAAPLAAHTGHQPTTIAELREFDAHLNHYIPIEELRADAEAWKAAVDAWMSPEAEEERQAFRRTVVTAIDAIAERHHAADETVAVVCHGGVINAYVTESVGLPGTVFFEPAYTSVSRLIHHGAYRQLVTLNEAPHLGRLVRPATA